jgi:hypothetical protein
VAVSGRLAGSLASVGMTLAALAAPSSSNAQIDGGRSFTVVTEPAKVGLGDSVRLRFRLTLNDRDLLTDTVPRPVAELPPGVRVLAVERLRRGADRVFSGTAVVAFYRTGRRALPSFGVPWIQIVSGRRGIVSHDPVEVEVASMLPAGNPPLRDIREPEAPRGLGLVWAVLGAALATAIAWLASRRRRTRPMLSPEPIAARQIPSPPDPYAIALSRLDLIEAERWSTRGDVARHYQEVADVLRDYLETAEGVPARERTSNELIWSLPPRLTEGGLRRRVQEILAEADLVKFAKLRPLPDQAARYTTQARDLVERWHRAAPVGEEHDAVR